jgi:uncharacterized coiled-coil protein SlyX
MTVNKKSELLQIEEITIAENGAKVLERERKLDALLQEQVETAALMAEARERIERQGRTITELNNSLVRRDAEIDRLNNSALMLSPAYEQLRYRNTILVESLRTWLQIFEQRFDSDENQEITEASDYMTHAKFMKDNYGRDDQGFLRRVTEWYNNQPAWKQTDKLK